MDTKTVNTIIAFLNAGYTADEIAEIAFKEEGRTRSGTTSEIMLKLTGISSSKLLMSTSHDNLDLVSYISQAVHIYYQHFSASNQYSLIHHGHGLHLPNYYKCQKSLSCF